MILRPVTPASPSGPPISNEPVGLICHSVSLVMKPSGRTSRMYGLTIAATSSDDRPGACWVDSTIEVARTGRPFS